MRKALVAGVLVAMVCAGCATTPGTLMTDVKVSPTGPPEQYTVDFRITEVNEDGTTDILSAPRITVLSGEEGEIKLVDAFKWEEISCKALVVEEDESVQVTTFVTLKEKGKRRWSSTQNISVLRKDQTEEATAF